MVLKGQLVPTGHEVCEYSIPLYGSQTAIDVDFYSAPAEAPDYVDAPECEYLGTVTVNLKPVMDLSLERRNIRVFMKFGETEIQCRVVLVETGQVLEHTLDFLAS